MSFNTNFSAASAADAEKILAEETLPDAVKAILRQGLTAFPTGPVAVKAVGHLYNGDYTCTTADICVEGIALRAPKPAEDTVAAQKD